MSWIIGIVPDNFWKENKNRIFSVPDSEGFYTGGGTSRSFSKNLIHAKRYKSHKEAYKQTLSKEMSPHNLMTLEINEDD
jgi:hypothetical protein